MDNNLIQHIGILGAMPAELGQILKSLKNIKKNSYGDLDLYSGIFYRDNKKPLFITTGWSGWGKVSAARATTRLCQSVYKSKCIDFLLFSGVAGAIDNSLKQWDVVIADSIIQHDLDASPMFKKFVSPSLNKDKLYTSKKLLEKLFTSLKKEKTKNTLVPYGNIHKGLIATGDSFISQTKKTMELIKEIPKLKAVEMEGAAFAQVAVQEKIDWILFRVISDNANEEAAINFDKFLKEYEKISWDLIKIFLKDL